MTRYRCVDDRKADGFPVADACQAAGVSTSAYYAWRATRRAGPTPQQRAVARLVAAIHRIHEASEGTYGAPRVTCELRDEGHQVNHKRVERLMRREGIVGRPRKRRSLTKQDAQAARAGPVGPAVRP